MVEMIFQVGCKKKQFCKKKNIYIFIIIYLFYLFSSHLLTGLSQECIKATVVSFCKFVFCFVHLFIIIHHRAMQLRHSLYITVNSTG